MGRLSNQGLVSRRSSSVLDMGVMEGSSPFDGQFGAIRVSLESE